MHNNKVFDILKENLDALKHIKKQCSKPRGEKISYNPFYCSLSIRDSESYFLESLNGSIITYIIPSPGNRLEGRIEMRMGHPKKGGGVDWGNFLLPRDFDKDMSKQQIRETCNNLFWTCADDLEFRYQRTLGEKNNRDKYIYFAKENPIQFIQKEKSLNFDLNSLEKEFRDIYKNLKTPWIKDIDITFEFLKEKRYYINSEGSKIFINSILYNIRLEVYAIDNKNLIIPVHFIKYGDESSKIPDSKSLIYEGKRIIKDLEEILKSPIQGNGAFPTILDSQNTGVLFHEVIGHALEGHRMQEDEEGTSTTLFKNKIGEKIAPEFIDLYDDPTVEYFNKIPLNGRFIYDEEGVKSRKVKLIENGILKNYLHSRQSAGYFKTTSNGHCRADESNNPCPRMGNIFVKSSNEVPFEKLKIFLIKECEKQKKPYGLLLKGASGGLIIPDESFYNTTAENAFRVYRNGKIERVRGIYIVGTPYQTMNGIIQTSNNYQIFNGYCSAESGNVPQSEVAPDSLVRNLEVNKIPDSTYDYVYESIFDKKSKK